jgi:hypothetical protein
MDRRSALAVLLTAIVAAAALFALYLVQSQMGLKGRAHGADWAAHLAMIDLILRGEDVRAHGPQIGTGIVSPLFAHRFAAELASVTNLSTVRAIGMVASLAVIVSVVVAAARSVWVVIAVARNPAARLAGWLAAAAAFFGFAILGLGFYGQIDQANYFFSQTVGTAAALLALSAVQAGMAGENRAAMLAVAGVPLLAFALAWIHLVPALWFAVAGSICALSLARPLRQRLALSGLLALLSLLLILSVPSSRDVLQLPQAAQAVLNLRLASGLLQLNRHPGLLVGGLAVLAVLIAIVALTEERAQLRFRLLNLHAGGIAVLVLGLLTLAGLIARGGTGYYGLSKYAFLFAAEATLLVAHVAAVMLNRYRAVPAVPAFAVLALVLTILAQQRVPPPERRDQTLLIEMQRALSDIALLPAPAPFPLDDRLSRNERLYLFTSPMGQKKDARARQLLAPSFEEGLAAAAASLPPSLIPTVVPPWRGGKIDFGKLPAPSPLVFFGRWGTARDEGRTAYAPAAHLASNIASETGELQLCLRVRLAGEGTLAPTFAINGSEIRSETFRGGEPSREVAVPLSGHRGDTVLSILNHAQAAPSAAAGEASLLLESIWLGSNCARLRVSVANGF